MHTKGQANLKMAARYFKLFVNRLAYTVQSPRPGVNGKHYYYRPNDRGAVCPVFYSRSGETATLPRELQTAAARLTSAVACTGCRHCHLLEPKPVAADAANEVTGPAERTNRERVDFGAARRIAMNEPFEASVLPEIDEVLADPAASFWLKAALHSALSRDPVDAANDSEILARLLERRCREIIESASKHPTLPAA
jgi:hypothetical protein